MSLAVRKISKVDTVVAIAGNPNSGKTTVFNAITGSRQHVGNYPGVTVEKKSGSIIFDRKRIDIVDLPGTYSLTAYSQEELVARKFLTEKGKKVVIDIVDASNLERNLYLAVQLMEMGLPLIIALNMIDVAKGRDIKIDHNRLSELLKVRIVPTVGNRKQGIDELILQASRSEKLPVSPTRLSYGKDIDTVLNRIESFLKDDDTITQNYNPSWLAIKLVEQDEEITQLIREKSHLASDIFKEVDALALHIKETLNDSPENVISDYRYGFITSVVKECVSRPELNRRTVSDKADKFLTHKLFGPLFLLGTLWGLYHFAFKAGAVPVSWMEGLFEWLHNIVASNMSEGFLRSMIVSGMIDGVGGVLGFVPIIMFMFFFIAILEDSGYMARIAYILDRVLRSFGMHGNSMLSLIVAGGIAGGCAVPGVLATRTLRDPKERLATILVAPFMNCGAKLPVFALLIAAFFSSQEGTIMFIITLLAWTFALVAAKILRSTILKGESSPFVMELPPYRIPTLKGLLIHMWERSWQYIKKAGTIILAISVLLWAFMTFPTLPAERSQKILSENAPAEAQKKLAQAELAYSAAGRLGTGLEHITEPLMGFDWRTNIALIGGFAAKEVVVATLGTAYSLGEVDPEESESLSQKLAADKGWTPLGAFSLIIFIMLYAPCFVTITVIKRETGSWKWAAFSMFYTTLAAVFMATSIYQVGTLLGIGIN